MRAVLLLAIAAAPLAAQTTDPYPTPINATEGVIRVDFREYASLPDIDGVAARMMHLVPEPGTGNVFVNDMRGQLYRVSADGRSVTLYVNIDDERWGHDVQSQGRERGFQSFAVHPQFNQAGTPGFGKFYTWSDVTDRTPAADFTPKGAGDSHDTVLLEWTARTPGAATYDGGAPRELMRFQQPFSNHNGGQLAFNPLMRDGHLDFGKLYIGVADGGSGGDPQNMSQDLTSAFGKILRIDPLGTNSRNGKYGIPADNPFVSRGRASALGEVWALGVRNPQRFAWDATTGTMYTSDIGQNIVEEVSPVPKGGNLGWNTWEGSFRYIGRSGVDPNGVRADASMTWPVAEYDHSDPVLTGRAAASGLVVVRTNAVPALRNRIVFADNPSGEIFHVSADSTALRGQAHVRRVLLNAGGQAMTILQLARQKNEQQGKTPASRVDVRLASGANGEVFVLNKADGVIRQLSGGR